MNSAILKVRVPEDLKNAVAQSAQDNGLDMSSFVRLVLTRATRDRNTPNAATQAAIQELDNGGGTKVNSVDEFWNTVFNK